MVEIHIQQNQGITHGILAKLTEQNIDTSKLDISVWNNIMNEVKAENNENAEDKKLYEGGDNFSAERSSWKDNFVVKLAQGATEKIIELSDALWNKIVNLVTGKSDAPADKPSDDREAITQQQPAQEEMQQKVPDESSETPTTPTDPNNDRTNLTEEQIKEKVLALNKGETITCTTTDNTPYMYTRNNDDTITETKSGLTNSYRAKKLNTVYDENMENKISEECISSDFLQNNNAPVSTINYTAGEKNNIVTDLSQINHVGSHTTGWDFGNFLKNSSQTGDYSKQEIKDKNGKVILTYENGKFYNKKGKEIDDSKAHDIINKAYNNRNLGELIQTYR